MRAVDAGLCGVIFLAPYFFGGRHDFGRLVLVLLIAATAIAWSSRQALRPSSQQPRTAAYVALLMASLLLVAQLLPLQPAFVARLSPAIADLLPLWNDAEFSGWRCLSLTPHETTKSLAMLVSYGLLFFVVVGRVGGTEDIERLLRWVALSAVLMAAFGVVHFFTSNGEFFWFYAHPHRSATANLCGPFINRNHFAHFLVLGVGPLVGWLLAIIAESTAAPAAPQPGHSPPAITPQRLLIWLLAAGLVLVAFAVLFSRSRGGALVLLLSSGSLTAIYMYKRLVDGRFIYGLIAFAAVVVGVLSVHGYDRVAERLDDFMHGSLDEIDQGGMRRKIWAGNLAAFNAFRLAGTGAGSHREVLPVFLGISVTKEYTHAENGYLQVATETGALGAALLLTGLLLCGSWCVACWRRVREPAEIRIFGAAAVGLVASAAHSMVDFVWYIPACMTLTIVLAACVLRIAQITSQSSDERNHFHEGSAGRWVRVGAVTAVAVWSVFIFVGPGIAALYWDRYWRASVAGMRLKQQQMTEIVASLRPTDPGPFDPLNATMLRNLEQAVKWDPQFARAHARLAAKYVERFELLKEGAPNAMGLAHIRDAALSSNFASREELHAWLRRALGENVQWLYLAAAEARRAVSLSPLQGEAYVYLGQFRFLEGGTAEASQAYMQQALRARPNEPDVLFEVGKQELISGDESSARERWRRCFGAAGPHQLKIVLLEAGPVAADEFLQIYQPDWRTLRDIWARYREFGVPEDLEPLLAYSVERTLYETQHVDPKRAGYIWYWQSRLFADAERQAEALACLERAYAVQPRHYGIRRALAGALQKAGRYAEAESHVRWCLARQPADRGLSDALLQLAKQRTAQRPAPAAFNPLPPASSRFPGHTETGTPAAPVVR